MGKLHQKVLSRNHKTRFQFRSIWTPRKKGSYKETTTQQENGGNPIRGGGCRGRFRGGGRPRRHRGRGGQRSLPSLKTANAEGDGYSEYSECPKGDGDEGKSKFNNNFNDDKHIQFIADSGATKHIVNKSFILTDFELTKNGIIESANENLFADIVIDGRGDLSHQSNGIEQKNLKFNCSKRYLRKLVIPQKIGECRFKHTFR